MCGIIGVVGTNQLKNVLLNGLKSLDYRGYDSCGIATILNSQLQTFRSSGRIENLEQILPSSLPTRIGIGHTRWATHGIPSVENSHPQLSNKKNFAIVHNGVIDNYLELKNELLKKDYTFSSETDTEVLVNLIEDIYEQNHDVLKTLEITLTKVKGSLAIALLLKNDEEKIYFAKRKSPLLLGVGNNINYLASDATAMYQLAQKFISLHDEEYGYISNHNLQIFSHGEKIKYEYLKLKTELLNQDLNGYPHHMLKEIEETPTCFARLINNYFINGKFNFNLEMIDTLKNAQNVTFIACGTSYHAGLVGKTFIESIGKHSNVYIASEWAYYPEFRDNEVIILISQSGETADLIACLELIKKKHKKCITITNTRGSTLDRECDWSLLLYAGVEIAVASTKAYSAQIALLFLLKSALIDDISCIDKLLRQTNYLKSIIAQKDKILILAKSIQSSSNILFIGRGLDYFLCLEASLKLKEISYIHSEAFAAGELKHGPLALVDENTPVFGFLTSGKSYDAIRGNFKEVQSRNGKLYPIVLKKYACKDDSFIFDAINEELAILGLALFAQYLAYYVALLKNRDIDKPRNLSKSVTVQ